jgi:hypothetical protein
MLARRGGIDGAAKLAAPSTDVDADACTGLDSGLDAAGTGEGSCTVARSGSLEQASIAAKIEVSAPSLRRSCLSPTLGMKLRQLRWIMVTTSLRV